jgi:hypothetical protein
MRETTHPDHRRSKNSLRILCSKDSPRKLSNNSPLRKALPGEELKGRLFAGPLVFQLAHNLNRLLCLLYVPLRDLQMVRR